MEGLRACTDNRKVSDGIKGFRAFSSLRSFIDFLWEETEIGQFYHENVKINYVELDKIKGNGRIIEGNGTHMKV